MAGSGIFQYVDTTPAAPSYTGGRKYVPGFQVVDDDPMPDPAPLGSKKKTAHFYPSTKDQVTLSCAVDPYDSASSTTKIASVTLMRKMDVVAPDADLNLTASNGTHFEPNAQNSSSLTTNVGLTNGMVFDYDATDPAGFTGGKVALCQLVRDNRNIEPGTTDDHSSTTLELDNAFPYTPSGTSSEAAANGGRLQSGDTPSQGIDPSFTSVTISNHYQISAIYKPANGEYVPITTKAWDWNPSSTKGAGGWSAPGGGPTSTNAEIAHLSTGMVEYTSVYTNH